MVRSYTELVATLRIGTRGSKLALWQAEHVAQRLAALHPGESFKIVVIRTSADKRPDVPLQSFGDKSLFIKEIEEALLAGSIDLAVHSLKDVPSHLSPEFALAAVLEREDARDVLLTGRAGTLPVGARVGTSSLRRESQLRAGFPKLNFVSIRGNVDTRLRKLGEGEYDGIVVAAAGLHRLDVPVPAEAYLPVETCLPAPGQAALCVETLAGRQAPAAGLDHASTRRAVEAERAFAAVLDAGCRVPVAAYAIDQHTSAPLQQPSVWLRTVVAANDGSRLIRAEGEGEDPIELGQRVAREALAQGAGELLAATR